MISATCICGEAFDVPDSMSGKIETCPACGLDVLVSTTSTAQQPAAPVVFRCPTCQSENIQRVSVLYESGTTVGTTTGGGVAFDDEGMIPMIGRQRTKTRSALATRYAPPSPADDGSTLVVVGVLLTAVGALFVFVGLLMEEPDAWPVLGAALLVFGLICLFLGVRRYRKASRYNSKQYPAAHQRWKRTWLCHRCGASFILQAGGSP